MSRFKEFKQKLKDNKGKIIAGIIFVSGVTYVIVGNVITGVICKEYDKGGNLETLKARMLKRD